MNIDFYIIYLIQITKSSVHQICTKVYMPKAHTHGYSDNHYNCIKINS